MSVESLQHEELVQLLELLCEDRLDRDQAARLEEIVLGDEHARRMYLEYLSLHGTLYWDAARGIDDESEVVEVGVAATEPIDRSPAAGRRTLVAVAVWVSAAALLLAVGLSWWPAEPSAGPEIAVADPSGLPIIEKKDLSLIHI